jgi:hypothetical protein
MYIKSEIKCWRDDITSELEVFDGWIHLTWNLNKHDSSMWADPPCSRYGPARAFKNRALLTLNK